MDYNQFYPITYGFSIKEVATKTKKRNAYITIELPEATANKFLKQIALGKATPIKNLELCWYDEDLVPVIDVPVITDKKA